MLADIPKIYLLCDIPLLVSAVERIIKNPVAAIKEDALSTYDFIANSANMRLLSQ